MPKCGNCGPDVCTCSLVKGPSTIVSGTGRANASAFQVRPEEPLYRYAGHAFQFEGGQLFFANTDTRINLTRDALAPLTGGNMWSSAAPNQLTASIDGLYLISALAARTDESFWNVWVSKNNQVSSPLVKRSTALPAGPNGAIQFLSMMTLVRLNAGDYLELYVRSGTTSIVIGEIAVGSLIGVDCCPYLASQWIGA